MIGTEYVSQENAALRASFPNGRPKELGLRLHLNSDTPYEILKSLPDNQAELVSGALKVVSPGFTLEDLCEDNIPPNVNELSFRMVGGFISNFVQAETYRSKAGPVLAVACGESGLINVLAAAGAISLEHGLASINELSGLVVRAQRKFAGGMFSVDLSRIYGRQTRAGIMEEIEALQGKEGSADESFCVEYSEDKKMVCIGAYRGEPIVNMVKIRVINPNITPVRLDYPKAPLGTPLMRSYEEEFKNVLAKIDINEPYPDIVIIGGRGSIVIPLEEAKREIVRELTEHNDAAKVKSALRKAGVREPMDIGLKNAPSGTRRNWKIIGLIAAGTAMAIGIGAYGYKRRLK